MAEYLDKEAFKKSVEERYCKPCKAEGRDHNGCKCDVCWVDDIRGDAIDAPAADVAPVVHGWWETNSDRPDSLICSICKFGFDMWKHDPHNYCPNCGAKMYGERKEGADNG